jgi:hypothetical protein
MHVYVEVMIIVKTRQSEMITNREIDSVSSFSLFHLL